MPHNNSYYEFGPFQLNIRQRVLARAGTVVPLSPKTMDLLFVLVRRAGELVKKDELMAELWPDSFVEEGNLSQNIFNIRKALGDQRADAQFVETIARHGYRFIAPVKFKDDRNNDLDGHEQSVTLAVLPFVNDTADDQLEYLADGIGENIIKSLSQLSTLRVMSRISTKRFKGKQIDLKELAAELKVNSLLFGRLTARDSQLAVTVELVDAVNGWLWWSDSFDFSVKDILTIQDEIVKQVMVTLGLQLSRDEEKTVTTRHTENSLAYKAYLEGRFFCSRFTLSGIENAIDHFRRAIDLDPNYALAYSACIDCYLRLATNYVPPEVSARVARQKRSQPNADPSNSEHKLRLRHEWDWKGAERELRRAQTLKSDYPGAHQWHAAYTFAQKLYEKHHGESWTNSDPREDASVQFRFASLTASEEVAVFCAIGREQIVVGNYAAARLVLDRWLPETGWPQLDHLDPHSAADLLFTLGNLLGVPSFSGGGGKRGFKRAESYLSGAIALAEQLGAETLGAEARIELARCYYRAGLYEEARELLDHVLGDLPANKSELRSLCLAVYGCVERDSGRLSDSLARLQEANMCETGQLVTGFRELQLATTLKELATMERSDELFVEAGHHFRKALYEFEAIGNHTQTAATENNFGYLLLSRAMFAQAEEHLLHALTLFTKFANDLCTAQVNETLAQLHLATGGLSRALDHADQAVTLLETTDGDAVLAEALHTKGLILSRLKRFSEARGCFEGSYRVAERCEDGNGACRALLSLVEDLSGQLLAQERSEISLRLAALRQRTAPGALVNRLERALEKV